MKESHQVYTIPQIASILHIGRNSAYALVKSGNIRCIRIGKNIRIPEAAVEEFLRSAQ